MHGQSTPSLKISCKSVQPFSRNLADKETKKSIENNTPSPDTIGDGVLILLIIKLPIRNSTSSGGGSSSSSSARTWCHIFQEFRSLAVSRARRAWRGSVLLKCDVVYSESTRAGLKRAGRPGTRGVGKVGHAPPPEIPMLKKLGVLVKTLLQWLLAHMSSSASAASPLCSWTPLGDFCSQSPPRFVPLQNKFLATPLPGTHLNPVLGAPCFGLMGSVC